MRFLLFLLVWGAAAELPNISEPGKILLSPSSINPTHKMVMMELAEALQKRGHEVVVWQIGIKPDGIKVPKGVEERFWEVDVPERYIRDMLLHRNASVYDHVWDESIQETQKKAANWMMSLRMCELALESRKKNFDALVAEEFDAVVVDDLYNPCGLLHTGTGMTDLMDFWERGSNILAYLKTIYIHHRIILRRLDVVFQKFYPGVTEAFYMERNASLNYINTPPIFDFTRPYMPRTTFVGGLHCRNATKLPNGALNDFVSKVDAKSGFVYVSMGMGVQWSRAPKSVVDTFINTFHALPQLSFVWQYDGPAIKDLPANVFTQAWVPQQELLGHKKCKGFVSAGGLNSVVESMFHNTPLLGIPLFAEAKDNIVRVTEREAGLMLEKQDLSQKALTNGIKRITTEAKLIEGAAVFSDLIHDVPYTELNHAVFWLEFITRHREIPQARSGADDLNIFQYFLVDVIAFLLACISLIIFIVFTVIRLSCRACCWGVKKTAGAVFGSKATPKKKKE